jgi:flagellar motor protein MotB
MLRAFLIIAVIAGAAGLAISHFKVAEKIRLVTEERDRFQQDSNNYQKQASDAKKKANEATAEADKAKRDLETLKTDYSAAAEKADQQEKRANELETRLNQTTQQKNDAQAELARWKAFGKSIEDIQATIVENKKLLGERDALSKENTVLGRQIKVLQTELAIFKGENPKIELPPNLKGKVVAVDPKYEFVVLDIGESQGVLRRGEMLVSRSGKLVAKIRILSVDANRSIANVLPDWKRSEIMEGDAVLVGL